MYIYECVLSFLALFSFSTSPPAPPPPPLNIYVCMYVCLHLPLMLLLHWFIFALVQNDSKRVSAHCMGFALCPIYIITASLETNNLSEKNSRAPYAQYYPTKHVVSLLHLPPFVLLFLVCMYGMIWCDPTHDDVIRLVRSRVSYVISCATHE